MTLKLDELRNKIDSLDRQFVQVFEQRMKVVEDVAAYKKMNNMQVLNAKREQEVIAKNIALLQDSKYAPQLQNILERLMQLSRSCQQAYITDNAEKPLPTATLDIANAKVGYQGVAGSFSHQALLEFFGGYNVQQKNYLNFEDVFEALKCGELDFAVLPVENSSTGAVSEIYDLLLKYDANIIGEHCLPIEQHLLTVEGCRMEDIQKVYSHPQGFKQSREFLITHPTWELIPYFNTAKSAEFVAECQDKTIAAIGSAQAAKLYGLNILAEKINFNNQNHTRFIILGRQTGSLPGSNKVSIIVSLPHKAGSLARMLSYFEQSNINLLKIESRPNINENWSYYFYVDFQGSLADNKVRQVVANVQADSLYFKILGNYLLK